MSAITAVLVLVVGVGKGSCIELFALSNTNTNN